MIREAPAYSGGLQRAELNAPNPTRQAQRAELNAPNSAHQTQRAKLSAPNSARQTQRTKLNAPNSTHQTQRTKPNAPNSTARECKRKPAGAAARRHAARPAARALRHGDRRRTARSGEAQRRRFAQQRAQRKTARTALQTQCRKEGMEPGANAVDRFGLAPLFAQCASARGVVTQRTHDVAARRTRRFQRGASKTGAQKSMHGFRSGQRVARRNVCQPQHQMCQWRGREGRRESPEFDLKAHEGRRNRRGRPVRAVKVWEWRSTCVQATRDS